MIYYQIEGGLQRACQSYQNEQPVQIVEKNDHLPETAMIKGRHTYTELWDANLGDLKQEVRK